MFLKKVTVFMYAITIASAGEMVRRGAVFVHHSTAFEVSSHWTVATSINTSVLFQAAESLENIATSISETAKKHSHYGFSEEELDGIIMKIRGVSDLTRELHNYLFTTRSERALLDFGSTILQYTIGVAKDSDVTALKERVEMLEKSEGAAIDLLGKQLSIINDTAVTSRQNKERLDKLTVTALDVAQHLDALAINTTLSQQRQQALLRIILTLTSLTKSAEELELALVQFQRGVQELSQGKLAEYFVHPTQFLSILKNINTKLPETLTFLHDISTPQLYKWYSYVQVKAAITKDGLIHLFMEVPLREKEIQYEIFKIHTFPVESIVNKKLFQMYDLRNSFMILSNDEQYFLPIKALDELNFRNIDESTNVIRLDSPMLTTEAESCEFALYQNNLGKVKDACHLRITDNPRDFFLRLNESTWLYALAAQSKIKWACPSFVNVLNFPKTVAGVGKLNIPYPCRLEINNRRLTSSFSGASPVVSHFVFNISRRNGACGRKQGGGKLERLRVHRRSFKLFEGFFHRRGRGGDKDRPIISPGSRITKGESKGESPSNKGLVGSRNHNSSPGSHHRTSWSLVLQQEKDKQPGSEAEESSEAARGTEPSFGRGSYSEGVEIGDAGNQQATSVTTFSSGGKRLSEKNSSTHREYNSPTSGKVLLLPRPVGGRVVKKGKVSEVRGRKRMRVKNNKRQISSSEERRLKLKKN